MNEWTQTLGVGPLLGIAVGAIALILVLVIWLRLHAFLVLIVVSLATALATGVPVDKIVSTMTGGFGGTLGSVALLVGLGAMLGRLVETSGGAQSLADALIRLFGESRAPLALGVASLIFGFPIFFDAGLIVMLPIIFATARRLGAPVLLYGMPAAGAFSVMHVFLPPHPGPIAASEYYGANVGVVMLIGLVIALPTWWIAGYFLGTRMGKKWPLPVPDLLAGGPKDDDQPADPPSAGVIIGLMLVPVGLIFLNTGLNMAGALGWVDPKASWVLTLRLIGETPIALLISVLVAALVLGRARGEKGSALEKTLDSALGPVCSVILVTGAGGMFGGVLRASGIGDALANTLGGIGVPVILACFLISLILRVAQGSATVALVTTAGLMGATVASGGFNGVQLAAIVLATAAGSVAASHVNDSGFWLVGRLMGMDVATTLRTWTVMETAISVIGFALSAIVFYGAGMFG